MDYKKRIGNENVCYKKIMKQGMSNLMEIKEVC